MVNMLFKYPVISDNVEVVQAPDQIYFYIINKNRKIKITEDAWQIYQKFNGLKNVNEIVNEIVAEWDIETQDIIDFVKEVENEKYIILNDKPLNQKIPLVEDTKYLLQSSVSIEITNRCNLKCIYCYGNYGPKNKDIISYKDIKKLLLFLKSKGIINIEITGGEPLIHPNFIEVFELALENFPSVSLLSNGSLFKDEHFTLIERNRGKAKLQISIDGITEETNKKVRCASNTWTGTLNTLKKLVEIRAGFRVVYMLTSLNLHEVKDACELMRKIGIKNFMVSLAENIGRGCETKCSLFQTVPDAKVTAFLQDLSNEYKDIWYNPFEKKEALGTIEQVCNCGAGWNMVGISANGDVIPCHIIGKEDIIGNIYINDYLSIFNCKKVNHFYYKFKKSPNEHACLSCDYQTYCARCLAKIYNANKKLLSQGKELCPIAQNNNMHSYIKFSV